MKFKVGDLVFFDGSINYCGIVIAINDKKISIKWFDGHVRPGRGSIATYDHRDAFIGRHFPMIKKIA